MKMMFPIYSLSINQTTPRSISPEEVAIEYNAYLYLNKNTEQIIGMEIMFDQGERMRQSTGKIIGRCLEAGVWMGMEDLLVLCS